MSETLNHPEAERTLHIGDSSIWTLVLGSQSTPERPTVIGFHGSGGGSESWTDLAHRTSAFARILLYDRADQGRSTRTRGENVHSVSSAAELSAILKVLSIDPPYVLVAHSYGGCIAREFLQKRNKDVAGMVLAETGQETLSKFKQQQYRKQALGNRPLSVIRANSLLTKQRELEQAMAEGKVPNPEATKVMLEQWDAEDERLKKEQLQLSSNNSYVHVPDCGHGIIRDRPDIVATEIEWVLERWEELATANNATTQKATRARIWLKKLVGSF